jgi:hypothetical protein
MGFPRTGAPRWHHLDPAAAGGQPQNIARFLLFLFSCIISKPIFKNSYGLHHVTAF